VKLFVAGQKAFGAAVLELALRKGHRVLGVSSPALSGSTTTTGDPLPDRLRELAALRGVPWMPAGTLTAETLPAGVDLILAAHSHDYVGRKTRLRARGGAIGYHPSLLPLHRGRDAVRWALHMGDRVTGGSIYVLTDNVDAGPILAQRHAFVRPGDTAESIWRRELFPMGVQLFADVLDLLEDADRRGCFHEAIGAAFHQDEELSTWEPSWERGPLRRPDLLLLPGSAPAPAADQDGDGVAASAAAHVAAAARFVGLAR